MSNMKKIILYQCEHCGFTTSQKILNCTACGHPNNKKNKRFYTTAQEYINRL